MKVAIVKWLLVERKEILAVHAALHISLSEGVPPPSEFVSSHNLLLIL